MGAWPWPSRSGMQHAAAGSVRSGPPHADACFSDSLSIASLHPILPQTKTGTMQPAQLTVKNFALSMEMEPEKLLTV